MPHDVIAGLRQLCHKHAVALRGHRHQAQAAGHRCVLGHREVFAGHVLGQAGGGIVAGGDHRVFTLEVPLLLSPIGSRDKAVETRQVEQETYQTDATRAACHADQMEGHHDAVYEGEPRTAWKERGQRGTESEGSGPDAPGVQGRARPLELCGGLSLGDALGSQRPVLRQEVRTCESIPVWLALRVAVWLVLDDGAHRDLLCPSLAFESSWRRMARSPTRFSLYWG